MHFNNNNGEHNMKNNNIDLCKKVSYLETRLDFLETELSNLDELLVQTGFPNGVETLKETARELILEMSLES
jgi:hypothetical protein